MHKRRLKTLLMVVLAVLGTLMGLQPVAAQNGPIVLKEQYQKGQSFNQVDYTQYQIWLSDGSEEVAIHTGFGMGYICQITNTLPDGGWGARMKVHSVYYEAPGLQGGVSLYDSSLLTALPDQGTAFFSYLVGDEIGLEVGATGELQDINFSNAFKAKVVNCFRSIEPSLDRDTIEALLVAAFKNNLNQDSANPEQGVFPDRPVAEGDSWEKEVVSEKNGWQYTFKMHYSLKQRREGIAYVELRSLLMAANPGAETPFVLQNSKGEMTGAIEVMEDSGWLRAYDICLKYGGEVKPANPEQKAEDSGELAREGKFKLEVSMSRKPLPLE